MTQLEEDIQDPDSPFLTTLIYGMRGSGKTTLLTDVSHDMVKQKNWIVVDLTMNEQLISTLIESVYIRADSELKKMISEIRGISLTAAGVKAMYNHDSTHIENSPHQILLESMAAMLKKKKLSLLVTIDEIKSTPALRKFAGIYQILLRNNYHIALLMAGLPSKVSELQNDELLTFLLRSQRIYLELLSPITIRESYQRTFTSGTKSITQSALLRMTQITNGYAYAFQLLGFLVWRTNGDKVTDKVVDKVIAQYQAELFRNVYIKMYQELSPKDREFINIMADSASDEVAMSYIGEKMKK